MKTMHTHLHKTKAMLHQTLDLMGNVKVGVANTSSHLMGTSAMYDNYEAELKKSEIYVRGLKKKEDCFMWPWPELKNKSTFHMPSRDTDGENSSIANPAGF